MNALEKALHERALEIAARYRKDESDLLEILQKLDEKKVFRVLGYSSLFQYALSELRLSELTAYSFIAVARKAREIPEIKSEIKSGNLSVAKAKRIVPVITPQNSGDWLEKAKTLPKAKLEKEVARVAPQTLTPERAHYVTEKRLNLQVGVTEELYEKLRRVKDLLSQKEKRSVTLEEALEAMVDSFIARKDPVEKAKRLVGRDNPEKQSLKLGPGPLFFTPKSIPSASRHAVYERDQGRCAARSSSGERCDQRRWLDIHHIQPRKAGGSHALENLQLLCFHHHKLRHIH